MAKSQETLLEAAVLCAMRGRYRYRGYETVEKARAALRRRCRGVPAQELDEAFARADAMYARAEEIVWENRGRLSAEECARLESQLLEEIPSLEAGAVRNALGWAYYWRILR